MRKFAYIRMVLIGQEEDALQAMIAEGIEERNIFVDKMQDKDSKCPGYDRMIKKLKPGDMVFVSDIGCLGGSYDDIIAQWKIITEEKKADIVVMDAPVLDTRKWKESLDVSVSDIVLAVLGCIANNERKKKEAVHHRNALAIAAAKERGVRFGTPEVRLPEGFDEAVAIWKDGELTLREAAKKCGMPKSTFYDKARKPVDKTIS